MARGFGGSMPNTRLREPFLQHLNANTGDTTRENGTTRAVLALVSPVGATPAN